jgi:hypothetical protein
MQSRRGSADTSVMTTTYSTAAPTWPLPARQLPWIEVPRQLVDDIRVSDPALRLWLVLAAWIGPAPTRHQIAARLGVSDSTITRLMAELVDAGWVVRPAPRSGVPGYTIQLVDHVAA